MAKARRRVRDTWREKSWYDIKTPVNILNYNLKLIMLQVL